MNKHIPLAAVLVLAFAVSAVLGLPSAPAVSAQAGTTPTPVPTPRPELVTVHRNTFAAQNKGDIAAVMANFADDAVLIHPYCPSPCVGKAAIQKVYELQAATHTQVDAATYWGESDNVVRFIGEVRADNIKALGLDRIVINSTLTFSGGKISRFAVLPEPSDPQSVTFVKAMQGDPETVFRLATAAVSRGDAAGYLAQFTDDAFVSGSTGCPATAPCTGKAALQTGVELAIKTHQVVDVLSTSVVTTNTIRLVNDIRNDNLKPMGVDRIIVTGNLMMTGNKISRLVLAPDLGDPQTAAWSKASAAQAGAAPAASSTTSVISVEANKALVRRYVDQVPNGGHFEVLADMLTPDYKRYLSASAAPINAAGNQQRLAGLRTVFPDLKITIDTLIAEGDWVVYRGTARATQQAAFMGIPATGKQAAITVIEVFRMQNGKIAEHWGGPDTMDMVQQMGGVVSAPPAK